MIAAEESDWNLARFFLVGCPSQFLVAVKAFGPSLHLSNEPTDCNSGRDSWRPVGMPAQRRISWIFVVAGHFLGFSKSPSFICCKSSTSRVAAKSSRAAWVRIIACSQSPSPRQLSMYQWKPRRIGSCHS